MNENEMMENILVATKVITSHNDFFIESSIIELKICDGQGTILETRDLIDWDLPMPAICLKLVHNISMLHSFYTNFSVQSNFNVLEYEFNESASFYLKLLVSAENINIIKRKGFGLFSYNVEDMSATLGQTTSAFKSYINDLVKDDKKLKDLSRVSKFINKIEYGLDPNAAMSLFISENRDLFKKYI